MNSYISTDAFREYGEQMYRKGVGDAAPRWIPVTERLPKADEEVLIYLWDNPSAYIAWVDQEGRWETNDFYVDKDYLPKAWMPLPRPYEPPKEES